MIPLRDNLKSRSFPLITVLLIGLNLYVFWQQINLNDQGFAQMIKTYGLTPLSLLEAINNTSTNPVDYIPLISNMFLHGGWIHLLGNLWYLWIFGDNIEDWLGKLSFLAFFICTGLIANITHILLDPFSAVPVIGASGAVSGVLGAYLILYPSAKLKVLVPIFIFLQIFEIPAVIFLGLWFFLQLNSSALAESGANIAWWAHIGGFLAGMLLIKLFPCRCKRSYYR